MQTHHIVNMIDQQIVQLQRVRTALQRIGDTAQPDVMRRGRPKGPVKTTEEDVSVSKRTAKRTMSAEGRAKIAAAQKARWAAQKKTDEPATRKYAAKPKPAKKKEAAAKKITPPETPDTTEAAAADV